ncbi:hypothetical protein DC094_08420 [Pelagibaculum spongiae]|uniref:Uncharacterized protein n=1 Tax=Pelagibaculum spongiae TaxID=2080658 RepID=A0A2V1H072_9GAMM|nr:hypothetical protein DC094_08420 [Pelagibaculum spongiae]
MLTALCLDNFTNRSAFSASDEPKNIWVYFAINFTLSKSPSINAVCAKQSTWALILGVIVLSRSLMLPRLEQLANSAIDHLKNILTQPY